MSYSLNVEPSTVTKGETAIATATVPDAPVESVSGDLVHRNTLEVRATTTLTVHHPDPTIGTLSDADTDYYVVFGELEVVQVDANSFEVRT